MERRKAILNIFVAIMVIAMFAFNIMAMRFDSEPIMIAIGLAILAAVMILGSLYIQRRYFMVEAKDEMLLSINTKARAWAGNAVILSIAAIAMWIFLFERDISMDGYGIGMMLLAIVIVYLYTWLIIRTVFTRRLSKDV